MAKCGKSGESNAEGYEEGPYDTWFDNYEV